MEQVDINWLAVLAAAIAGCVLGALWYGPLFGKVWMRAAGMDPENLERTSAKAMRQLLTITFILQWIMALCLAFFIGNQADALMGTLYGFLTGLPWVALALTVNALFERRKLDYMLVNGAYWTANFTLMGLLIGWLQ